MTIVTGEHGLEDRLQFNRTHLFMLLSKFMQVVPCRFTKIADRTNLTSSFTRKFEQRTFKALLLDKNATTQYTRDDEGTRNLHKRRLT